MSDEYSMLMGEISISRSTLHKVIYMVPEDQLEVLLDQLSGTLADLKRRWSDRLSPHQEGVLEELERIVFRLRHREKFRSGNESADQRPYFICRKCETAIVGLDLAKLTCPMCCTTRWVELVYA